MSNGVPVLTYSRVRLAWCRVALTNLLRRWAVYFAVGLVALGSNASSSWDAMTGLAAWSVLPLFQAATQPAWIALGAVGLHSLIGAMLLFALRPVLWSRTWADIERALPIEPSARRATDAAVAGLGLMPLFLAYATGAVVWFARSPAWLHGARAVSLMMLAVSMILSVGWGVVIQHGIRRPPSGLGHAATFVSNRPSRPRRASPIPAWWAMLLLPMWRGPARRTGQWVVGGGLLLGAACAAVVIWPAGASWILAGLAALGLSLTARLAAIVTTELQPLHAACLPLPIAPERLLRMRRTVAMLPQTLWLAALCATVLAGALPVHRWVFAAYVVVAWCGGLAQTLLGTQEASAGIDPAARSSGWLFTLVLLVALASEVVAWPT